MTDQTTEPDEQDPDDERAERWADLAPDSSTSDQVPDRPQDDESTPGSLGGDNGGA